MNRRVHLRRGRGNPGFSRRQPRCWTACGIIAPRAATTFQRPRVTCDNCQRALLYHRGRTASRRHGR